MTADIFEPFRTGEFPEMTAEVLKYHGLLQDEGIRYTNKDADFAVTIEMRSLITSVIHVVDFT